MSTRTQLEEILDLAVRDASQWRKTSLEKRSIILNKTADLLSTRRGELIGCMAAITGKTFMEGDVEVSEGIDFCRYYPNSMQIFENLRSISSSPKGVILVIPPWNFPLAIPVGGVAAALAGGNTVILKPATVAFPVAWKFARCFWEAGVPKDALQVICPDDRSSLNWLSAHPEVKHIILTGGTETAFSILKNSPKTSLSAETGGKNAIIVTASADQDHAIQNIVSSAFGNAGQKCSACSLLLLDKTIYHDIKFQSKLKDAVASMYTGSVWDTGNKVGPMITNNNDKLIYAIENLEEGESWLVPPAFVDEKKYILKPCVKWGVKPGNYTFKTELFAPLLSVVCIDNLEQGLQYANSTEYGLTAGLQTLDEREIHFWKDNMEAGSLYINRGITGAIVRRQPFGGMKRSAFGAGIKAGGPNYVSCFVEFKENKFNAQPAEIQYPFMEVIKIEEFPEPERLQYAFYSYKKSWEEEFSKECDVSHIVGEMNTFRYLPLNKMALYVQHSDSLTDVILSLYAVSFTRTVLEVIIPPEYTGMKILEKIGYTVSNITLTTMTESDFIQNMNNYERMRVLSSGISDAIFYKAADLGLYIAGNKVLAEGRIELLHYLKEQSISYEYHRYGSIIEKPEFI